MTPLKLRIDPNSISRQTDVCLGLATGTRRDARRNATTVEFRCGSVTLLPYMHFVLLKLLPLRHRRHVRLYGRAAVEHCRSLCWHVLVCGISARDGRKICAGRVCSSATCGKSKICCSRLCGGCSICWFQRCAGVGCLTEVGKRAEAGSVRQVLGSAQA